MRSKAQAAYGKLQSLSEEESRVQQVEIESGRREIDRLNRVVAALEAHTLTLPPHDPHAHTSVLEASMQQEQGEKRNLAEKAGLIDLQDAQITKLRERSLAAEQRADALEAALKAAHGGSVDGEELDLSHFGDKRDLEEQLAAAFDVAKENEDRAVAYGKQLQATQQAHLESLQAILISNGTFVDILSLRRMFDRVDGDRDGRVHRREMIVALRRDPKNVRKYLGFTTHTDERAFEAQLFRCALGLWCTCEGVGLTHFSLGAGAVHLDRRQPRALDHVGRIREARPDGGTPKRCCHSRLSPVRPR